MLDDIEPGTKHGINPHPFTLRALKPELLMVLRHVGMDLLAVRYSFFVHRIAPRWRLVIAESGAFPERTTADQWQHSRDRAEADTNPDVRAEVQRAGYCLFAISASFDELDRDLRSANHGGRR